MQLRFEALDAHLAKPLSPLYVIASDEHLLALEAADKIRKTARAQGFFDKAGQALPPGDRRALVAAEIMAAIYSRLLDKMMRDRFRVFDRRYSLPKWQKLALVFRTILATRMSG